MKRIALVNTFEKWPILCKTLLFFMLHIGVSSIAGQLPAGNIRAPFSDNSLMQTISTGIVLSLTFPSQKGATRTVPSLAGYNSPILFEKTLFD